MKVLFSLLWVALGLSLRAVDSWGPRVSLEEKWRWTELERLQNYDIISGANGLNGEVWFVHTGGLLSFDGFEVEDHPIPRLKTERVLKFSVLKDGRLIMTSGSNLIVWNNGRVDTIPCPEGTAFIRWGVVENSRGQAFVATNRGIYQVEEDRLIEIKVEGENFTSILIDANDHLWVGGRSGYPTKVYQLNLLAGRPVAVLLHQFASNRESTYGPRLFIDSLDRVWVLDPDENDQTYLYEDYERKPAIRGLREEGLLLDSLGVTETSAGDVWFSVSRNLARWNGRKLKVYSIEDYPVPSSYPYLIDLPEDRLLMGGQKLVPLVINLSAERWATYPDLNFQCEDAEGAWWFLAKDRRVVRYEGGSWEVFTAKDGVIGKPNRIIAGSDGTIWVSGAHGGNAAVALYQDKQWTAYQFPEAGKTFSHLAAIETNEGDIVFGAGTPVNELGDAGGGAVVFTKQHGVYKSVHYPPPTFSPRAANIVTREGDGLYCSTFAVFKVSSDEAYVNQTRNLFSNQWIDHMMTDQNNDLWVAGVGAGVFQYNGQNWNRHGHANGLKTKNVIYLLDYQPRGQLLALTDEGFYGYDGTVWGRWGFPLDFPFRRENHTVFQSEEGAVWLNFNSRRWLLERRGFGRHNYEFQAIRYVPDRTPPPDSCEDRKHALS